jgi:hypothetical protein
MNNHHSKSYINNHGEPTSNTAAESSTTSLSNLLEPASTNTTTTNLEMNRNNTNVHASTSHNNLNPAVYMTSGEQDELSTNLDQTVLNLVAPNSNIMSMLGDAISQQRHHHGSAPVHQLTAQQQQELLQQVLQQQQNGGGEQAAGAAGQPGAEPAGFVSVVIKALQSSLPFIIILVAKIFHQHLLGFFIVLGFITTLHWSNRTLVNQVQLKVNKIYA